MDNAKIGSIQKQLESIWNPAYENLANVQSSATKVIGLYLEMKKEYKKLYDAEKIDEKTYARIIKKIDTKITLFSNVFKNIPVGVLVVDKIKEFD